MLCQLLRVSPEMSTERSADVSQGPTDLDQRLLNDSFKDRR